MSQFDCYRLQMVYLTVEHHPERNLPHKTWQNTFDTFDQLEHLLHALHKSLCVCVFHCVFTFLEIIKYNMLEMLHIFSHFSFKMAKQNFTSFAKYFLMHADMTGATIQSNKIISNEIKDN